jgi:hypothetical protein
MSLFADVVHTLEQAGVRHALIGAAALAVRGTSRATADGEVPRLPAEARQLWSRLRAEG